MYESIHIKRFRQFQELSLSGLTRVNLFVGRNNAGKTSILEAIELLAFGATPPALLRSGQRRGERLAPHVSLRDAPARWASLVDLRHLFFGHKIEEGTSFALWGRSGTSETLVQCEVTQVLRDEAQLEMAADRVEVGPQLALSLTGRNHAGPPIVVPLSPDGSALSETRIRPATAGAQEPPTPVVFLAIDGSEPRELARTWGKIVLTPEEDKVTAAMRFVEPAIERLAFGADASDSGVVVKLKGSELPVPLGSLGDGSRRMLALALLLARASSGVLLVDEIDTGLHYSTLESMWRLVIETARRLNVQIFATTHSGDCTRALAWLQADAPELAAEVSVHRIEKGATEAVRYSAEELEIAAQHHIEIRG
jgi:energy-coupling factor transporter ATP-binding protein EcfA2